MKILISIAGSHGDILAFIALGREFKARGHDVILYLNPFFSRYWLDISLDTLNFFYGYPNKKYGPGLGFIESAGIGGFLYQPPGFQEPEPVRRLRYRQSRRC